MFLKNKNIIFKIRRSKVTDYAALTMLFFIIFCKIIVIKHCYKILNIAHNTRRYIVHVSSIKFDTVDPFARP